MGKIVVGCWDCDYCGADRISGEIKICPNCGKPRGKDITFYMAGPKEYVKDPDKINKNPDWLCPYCNTLNPDDGSWRRSGKRQGVRLREPMSPRRLRAGAGFRCSLLCSSRPDS